MDKKDILKIIEDYPSDYRFVGLSDIVTGDNKNILSEVEDYLDEKCGNGHISRWNDFGNALYNTALCAQRDINNEDRN